jgi:aminomethyltransferase
MGNFKIYGEQRYDFLEKMAPGDLKELKKGTATLCILLNKEGGVVDDTIITNMGDYM